MRIYTILLILFFVITIVGCTTKVDTSVQKNTIPTGEGNTVQNDVVSDTTTTRVVTPKVEEEKPPLPPE